MNNQRGVALILVLMLSMLLAVIAIGFQTHSRSQVDRLEKQVIKAELVFLLESELNKLLFEMATTRLLSANEQLARRYALQNGDVSVEIVVNSYRNRLSLMEVGYEQLRRLFVANGWSEREAQTAADSLADWIDVDDSRKMNGFESADYARRGKPAAKNGFVTSIDELQRINGFELFSADMLGRIFTVYPVGDVDKVNASAELLSAFFSDDIVLSLVEARLNGSYNAQEYSRITGDSNTHANSVGQYFLEIMITLTKKNVVEQKLLDVKIAPMKVTPISILATKL